MNDLGLISLETGALLNANDIVKSKREHQLYNGKLESQVVYSKMLTRHFNRWHI